MGSPLIFPASGGTLKKFQSPSVDLNGTGDRVTFTNLPSTPYVVDSLTIHGWSTTPSASLVMTLRDGALASGNSLVGSLSGLNVLVSSTAISAEARPHVSVLGTNRTLTSSNLYLNASVANGSALTANITLTIRIL